LSELVIIVTGSRTWTNVDAVRQALRSVLPAGHRAIVYHGACPTGADRIVADLPPHPRVTIVPMPADWKTYGDSAGPRRNTEMVAAAKFDAERRGCPIVCVAFRMPGKSDGTDDCVAKVEAAGIRVVRVKP
jgi:hypothetical protein